MARTLEAVKGRGGSVKVGTTGTISSLMTRELESAKSANQRAVPSRNKPRAVAVSVPYGATTPKRLQPRKSFEETSSRGAKYKDPAVTRKMKSFNGGHQHVAMLGSENIAFDRTPSRKKSDRRGPNIVEIVDIKCGRTERRAWASPISSRLKKLGFARLSESIL